MRCLVLLRAVTVPATPPPPELMAAIATLGEEATNAGVLLDTQGLHPSSAGTRVALAGGQLSAVDGPFTEGRELISYAIYDVRTIEDAVEWTNRFLKAHRDSWPGWEGEADVLRVFGPEDFATLADPTSTA
ncbi:YciI family protein [Nakamurella sp. GG22]